MKQKKNQGFSLVELIIVIAILAILVGVLAPQYIKYVEKSRISADDDVADTLLTAGYLMAADEDYIDNLTDGDNIVLSSSGVTVSETRTGVSSGLDEFAPGWSGKKVTSKNYKARKYTVLFTDSSKGFLVEGSWSP